MLEAYPLIGRLDQEKVVRSSNGYHQGLHALRGGLLRDSGDFTVMDVDGVDQADDGLCSNPFVPVFRLEGVRGRIRWRLGA